jgi:prophage maintenance system killer protein
MNIKSIEKDVVIYQTKYGAIELKGDFQKETIWATQAQIAGAFDVDVRTVNEHIKNIYKSEELEEKSTLRNFRIVQKEGVREIGRELQHYNLDAILSVGYRINSRKATLFRQWATKTLHAHIVDGYTINRSRIGKNYGTFLKAVEQVKLLLPESGTLGADSVLDLVTLFASTWISLDAYDTSSLPKFGATQKQVSLTAQNLESVLKELKIELIKRKQATDLFGQERQKDSFASIVGNVFQSFGGKDLYPSAEQKAAHLLYFVVKDHPFADGNKRSGAFVFIWLLKKVRLLNVTRLTPQALTALTLLVAESDPKNKDKLIGLILLLLKK